MDRMGGLHHPLSSRGGTGWYEGDIMNNEEGEVYKYGSSDNLNFKVIKRFWNGEYGYFDLEVKYSGKVRRYRVRVARGRRTYLVGINSPPTIPMGQIDLLLDDFELDGRERKYLKRYLKRQVYALVNSIRDRPSIIYRGKFLNARVYGYADGTLKIFYKDKVYQMDADDESTLKKALYEVCVFEGLDHNTSSKRIEEYLRELNRSYIPPHIVEAPDGTQIRIADHEDSDPLVDGRVEFPLWIWGVFKHGDVEVEGAKAVLVESGGDGIEFLSMPIPEDVLVGVKYELVENCVLNVREMKELKSCIDNREVPSWREVYNGILGMIKEYAGLDDRGYTIIALFIIHSYFYELFPHTLYLIIVGESGSGKRNTKMFIAKTTRSISVASPTIASMTRIINEVRGCLIVDETRFDEFLRYFFNIGSQKGAFVIRCDRDNPNIIVTLNAYSPKVFVCQHSQLSMLPEDTRNRSIVIQMVRRKGAYRREIRREDVWDLVKKLYLLMIFRWREYLEAYRMLDPIVSKYLGGHARDKWLHIISLSYLIGRDVLERVLDYCIEEYRRREEFSEVVRYTINGILRALYLSLTTGTGEVLRKYDIDELVDEVRVERDEKRVRLTPKAIVIANEGYYDGKDREHRSTVRRVGKLLKRAELEFVVGYSREGKGRTRFHTIDLRKLYDYLKGYEPELPEDIDYGLIRDEIGLDFESIGSRLSEFRSRVLEVWDRKKGNTSKSENMSATSEMSATNHIHEKEKKEEKESEKEEKIEKELEKIKGEFKKEEGAEKKLEADISDMTDIFSPENVIGNLRKHGVKVLGEWSSRVSEFLEWLKTCSGVDYDIACNMLMLEFRVAKRKDEAEKCLEELEKMGIIRIERERWGYGRVYYTGG